MVNYWTEYWRQGCLTSFGEDIKGNYEGTLTQGWHAFFSSLTGDNIKLVDVGTGNGALIDTAVYQSGRNDISYIGVDYAALNVGPNLKKTNIVFYEKTDAAALPFDDASINVLVSQFGIEYSDLARAIPECIRVLKPEGILRFVMHSENSSIVKPNLQILSALTLLKGDSGPLFYLRQLINALAKYGMQSAQAESARNALNSSLDISVKQNKAGLYGTRFPEFLSAVMKPSLSFKDRKSMLKAFESEMKGQVVRLNDLVSAARSDNDIAQLNDELTALGMESVASEDIYQDGKLIGTLVNAVKASA